MPPCGICQTWVLSTCSGPSMRRPMKTLPSRLNTARPAQGRYGKDSNEGMEGELADNSGYERIQNCLTRNPGCADSSAAFRFQVATAFAALKRNSGLLGISAAGVAVDERFWSGARPRQARSDRPFSRVPPE